jgi:hypothetical protein
MTDAYFAMHQSRRSIMRVGDPTDVTPERASETSRARAASGEDLSLEIAPLIAQREESIVVRVHGEVYDESKRPASYWDASAETKHD